MKPSDTGGSHDAFDEWASIILPALGILVAIAVPLIVLYWQRRVDDRRLARQRAIDDRRIDEEREQSEQERAAERRRRATRDAIAELAVFHGLDPMEDPVKPRFASVWAVLMALVDEYPAGHPINDLAGTQIHLGRATQRAIDEDRNRLRRSTPHQRQIAVAPLFRWADYFIRDLRAVESGASAADVRDRTSTAQAALETLFYNNDWGEAPSPNIRHEPPK